MWLLLAAAALALLGGGCRAADDPDDIAAASRRTAERGTFRIEIRSTAGEGGQAGKAACEGVADPARSRFRLRCEFGGTQERESLELIGIQRTVYTRFEPSEAATPWQKAVAGEDAPPDFLDPEETLDLLRSAGRGIERVGDEEVRGVPASRYRMTVDREEADLGDGPGGAAPVDVWIGRDGLVRRVRLEDGGAHVTFEFYDFGVEAEIEPPPQDQVRELDSDESGETEGPAPEESEPCEPRLASPITEEAALRALEAHGIHARAGVCANDMTTLTNASEEDAADVLEREGIVFCLLHRRPPAGAPTAVHRRGAEGGDAELVLANLDCTILADSPDGEAKVARLERALEDLRRSLRP